MNKQKNYKLEPMPISKRIIIERIRMIKTTTVNGYNCFTDITIVKNKLMGFNTVAFFLAKKTIGSLGLCGWICFLFV